LAQDFLSSLDQPVRFCGRFVRQGHSSLSFQLNSASIIRFIGSDISFQVQMLAHRNVLPDLLLFA
jgi:hypothetical protein